jgi:hypothetical protein
MAMELESLQRIFAAALGDSQYESPLLSRLKPVPSTSSLDPARVDRGEAADTHAHDASDQSLRRRVGLYRGNVRGQWRAALANAYPVLLALTGDTYFDALSLAYGRAHPSHSGDLNRFGDALPSFIEQYEQHSRFRYFGDMARLEWSLHVASFAADVEAFTPQQWFEIGQERLLRAQLLVNRMHGDRLSACDSRHLARSSAGWGLPTGYPRPVVDRSRASAMATHNTGSHCGCIRSLCRAAAWQYA